MRDQGYSFIFVIDGLDAHSILLAKKAFQERIQKEIDGIIQGDSSWPKGLYLLCMREGTYTHYRKTFPPDQTNIPLRAIWEIAPVSPRKVIDKRKELIKFWLGKALETPRHNQQAFSSPPLPDPELVETLIAMTNEAIDTIFKEAKMPGLIEEVAKTGHIRAILEFFREAANVVMGIADRFFTRQGIYPWTGPRPGDDRDKWWDSIQPHLEKLRKEILPKKTYLLWSAATLSAVHQIEPPIKISEGEPITASPTGDLPLIPNPWGNLSFGEDTTPPFNPAGWSPTLHYLLIKCVVMQYLKAQPNQEADMVKMGEEISLMFGYDEWKVYEYIRCMILERILRFSQTSLGLRYSPTTVVTLSPVGEKAYTEWITNPDYLEHTMQLSVVPDTLVRDKEFERFPTPGTLIDLQQMEDRMQLEREVRREKRDQKEVEVEPSAYLPRLFRTWARFIALAKLLARYLKYRYNSYCAACKLRGKNVTFRPSFDFLDELQKNMAKKVDMIVDDAFTRNYSQILKALSKEYLKGRDARRLSSLATTTISL